jgi:hypothetical protein
MMLASCAATKQEVIDRLGSQYIGKNVDVLVGQFGPPAATFKMNSGQTSYQWQLSNFTGRASRYGSASQTVFSKVSVIAAPNGTINQLNTEDADFLDGSICAERLGMQIRAKASSGSFRPVTTSRRGASGTRGRAA